MTNIKLKNHRADGPLVLRRAGKIYELTSHDSCSMPANVAVWMLGDEGLEIEFNKEDKKSILEFNSEELRLLNREFSLDGTAKDAANHLFPTKLKPKKKVEKQLKFEDIVKTTKSKTIDSKKSKIDAKK